MSATSAVRPRRERTEGAPQREENRVDDERADREAAPAERARVGDGAEEDSRALRVVAETAEARRLAMQAVVVAVERGVVHRRGRKGRVRGLNDVGHGGEDERDEKSK